MPGSDTLSWTKMIARYAKCGNTDCARKVFDKMPERNAFSWNAMIALYTRNGNDVDALYLFRRMQMAGMKPDQYTFTSTLSACAGLASLKHGKQVHAHTIKIGFETFVCVGNTLVTMYAKCSSIEDARQVFDRMNVRDVFSWTSMIAGYSKGGSMEYARQLFDEMPEQNVVSWNAMIAGYAQHGYGEEALKLFCRMRWTVLNSDQFTFASVLGLCASLEDRELGKQMHVHITKTGFESDVSVGNALATMYAKCRKIESAQNVFDKMAERNVVTWNVMIAGYANQGCNKTSLKMFWEMQQACIKPTQLTFVSVLSACASLLALEPGKQVHAYIIRTGFESHVPVGNSFVTMYAKCRCIENARHVFDKIPDRDLVSWNVVKDIYSTSINRAQSCVVIVSL